MADVASDQREIRERIGNLANEPNIVRYVSVPKGDLLSLLGTYDRLAALEPAFMKMYGRWYIRSPHGYMPLADDIAYLVARAFEHPEWPENPGGITYQEA